ncbi:MAG: hypothetical protein KAU16_07285 [Methanophagales archaeon]|nr:hypothetical protein [Methanophagales archaeon]
MKKLGIMTLLAICLLILVIGLYIGYNGQKSAKQLTEEEKARVISIALNDLGVREEIRDKGYELGDVDLCWLEQVYKEESTSGTYPCLRIYIGGKEQTGVTLVVFVDLKEERVIHIGRDYRR